MRAVLLGSYLLIPAFPPARAATPIPEPTVDLGDTSFLDGEAGPGGLLEFIGNGYSATSITGADGHAVLGTNSQSSASLTLHPAYVSNIPFLGGHFGLEFLFPFAAIRLEAPGVPQTTQGGAGDITVAPFVQWSGLNLLDRAFSMRLGLQGVTPTGSYSPRRLLNVGQNVWQVSPYYAFTWHATGNWEVSGRLIYDWSSRNSKPPDQLAASSAQPGDQFAMDLSASYTLSATWRAGVASYTLRQLSDTRLDDEPVASSKQRVFGIGPAALWTTHHVTVIGNVYREVAAENRPQGFNGMLRLLCPF